MTNPFDTPPPAPARRSFPTKIVAIIVAVILALVAVGAVISLQNKKPSNCSSDAIFGSSLTEAEIKDIHDDSESIELPFCNGTWAHLTIDGQDFITAWTGEKWVPYERNQITFLSRGYSCFRESGLRADGAPDELIEQLNLCSADDEATWSNR